MPNKFERISRQKLREQLIADYLKRKEEEKEENNANGNTQDGTDKAISYLAFHEATML